MRPINLSKEINAIDQAVKAKNHTEALTRIQRLVSAFVKGEYYPIAEIMPRKILPLELTRINIFFNTWIFKVPYQFKGSILFYYADLIQDVDPNLAQQSRQKGIFFSAKKTHISRFFERCGIFNVVASEAKVEPNPKRFKKQ